VDVGSLVDRAVQHVVDGERLNLRAAAAALLAHEEELLRQLLGAVGQQLVLDAAHVLELLEPQALHLEALVVARPVVERRQREVVQNRLHRQRERLQPHRVAERRVVVVHMRRHLHHGVRSTRLALLGK
jgi:hypothetical protein